MEPAVEQGPSLSLYLGKPSSLGLRTEKEEEGKSDLLPIHKRAPRPTPAPRLLLAPFAGAGLDWLARADC